MKPFSSVLFIVIAVILFLKHKEYYQLYLPVIGFFVNSFYNNSIFTNLDTQNVYFKIFSDNSENLFDFYIQNIYLIFRQEIFIDKVITLFLLLYLFVKLKSFKEKRNFNILNLILFKPFSCFISIFNNLERYRIRLSLQIYFFIYKYLFYRLTNFDRQNFKRRF